jgi:hypothetical protein
MCCEKYDTCILYLICLSICLLPVFCECIAVFSLVIKSYIVIEVVHFSKQ